jgi:predicted dehydrogenase
MSRLKIAIIGCGNIAQPYAERVGTFPHLELAGFFDVVPERAQEFAKKYGMKAFPSIENLLSDPSIDLVVNLTIHHVHFEITSKCLKAKKHVYSEKPLALSYAETKTLSELAIKEGVRLGSAPITYMGEAQQTAWKAIREGQLGKVRLVYSEINHGPIESWHPRPEPFYDVGVLWDVGVYPITILTAFFGPVRKVHGFGRILLKDRKTNEGVPFSIKTPDFYLSILDFENGVTARLSANFYALATNQAGSIEFHGDAASLRLGSFQQFHAPVEMGKSRPELKPVPPIRTPFQGTDFCRGIEEMGNAILENRPHQCSAEHAAHVVDVIESITKSITQEKSINLNSSFTPPLPCAWAEATAKK